MALNKSAVQTCAALLQAYRDKKSTVQNQVKLQFTGVGDKDVYNITAPFQIDGVTVIAGRVESRDSEHSEIHFFVEQDGTWVPKEGAPVFTLQDPFFTFIQGELVLGGVEIFPHPTMENALMWRTVFRKGKTLNDLSPFFTGPDAMKDLRLTELAGGEIGVFTRPQGEKGGRGKIGFTRVKSLDDVTVELVNDAPLLADQFIDAEWGGANELHILNNGLVGVLGHVASFDEAGDRHYYPMVFALDPQTGAFSDMELIAVRAEFLPGETKRPDLADVVFSGGLVRKPDGTADLYAGISDAEAHRVTIEDPFLKFEQ
ncbi:DUF1861 family protein [Paenibacillus sp. p3-SID867]|uniref:MTP-1 family protein n=1 Tax=Paenibacillus sp. p3-SID867 TaxID=2916363 RepID=UPI0021A3F23A|nr:DUF1861 family protein [Paenibacillus sp. p3-SID867]MCT1399469.1 DUF1861 family protein [Paenibacillus sp. p3-SID867]